MVIIWQRRYSLAVYVGYFPYLHAEYNHYTLQMSTNAGAPNKQCVVKTTPLIATEIIWLVITYCWLDLSQFSCVCRFKDGKSIRVNGWPAVTWNVWLSRYIPTNYWHLRQSPSKMLKGADTSGPFFFQSQLFIDMQFRSDINDQLQKVPEHGIFVGCSAER